MPTLLVATRRICHHILYWVKKKYIYFQAELFIQYFYLWTQVNWYSSVIWILYSGYADEQKIIVFHDHVDISEILCSNTVFDVICSHVYTCCTLSVSVWQKTRLTPLGMTGIHPRPLSSGRTKSWTWLTKLDNLPSVNIGSSPLSWNWFRYRSVHIHVHNLFDGCFTPYSRISSCVLRESKC